MLCTISRGTKRSLPPLFLDEMAQLALHGFEGVVDHFVERIVRAVVFPLFVGDELVTARNSHIYANAELISFVMGVVRLFDRHITAVNVIAKFFKMRGFFQYEVVDLVRFFQTPVADFDRQLHTQLDTV
jgi:hypothetical protein